MNPQTVISPDCRLPGGPVVAISEVNGCVFVKTERGPVYRVNPDRTFTQIFWCAAFRGGGCE